VADNTGAKLVQVIKVLGGSKRRYARLATSFVVSVKLAEPRKAVKKKEVLRASSSGSASLFAGRTVHISVSTTTPR